MCCRRDTTARGLRKLHVWLCALLTNSAALDFSWFQDANNSGVINIVCSGTPSMIRQYLLKAVLVHECM
jgi:hypothetical protein